MRISSAMAGRDLWKVIDRVSELELGGAVNGARHRTMAESGAAILESLAARGSASRYIGETEKNLDAVFKDAERAGATLLFDEADVLLGKRGDVQDARDRYANLEVSGPLRRIERYEADPNDCCASSPRKD